MKVSGPETRRNACRYSLLLLTASLILPLHAATFRSDAAFHILYINQQPLGLFQSHTDELAIGAGKHQLVLRYEQKFGHKQNSETVRSEPIVILLTLEAQQRIELKTDLPRDFASARQFAASPQFSLQDRSGATVRYEHYLLPFQPGMQITRNYLSEIATYESSRAPGQETQPGSQAQVPEADVSPVAADTSVQRAGETVSASGDSSVAQPASAALTPDLAVPSAAVATAASQTGSATAAPRQVTPEQAPGLKPQPPVSDDPLTALKQLYQQLDKPQRKAFQIWIIEQQ